MPPSRFRPAVEPLEGRVAPAADVTRLLANAHQEPETVGGRSHTRLAHVGTAVVYLAGTPDGVGTALWRSDGTPAGTALLRTFAEGQIDADFPLVPTGGRAFFEAYNPDGTFSAIWATDGTVAGTVPVFGPGVAAGHDSAGVGVSVGGVHYFVGGTIDDGAELWRSDGTVAGTTRVSSVDGSLEYALGAAPGGGVLFVARDALTFEYALWRSDGTPAGTAPVHALPALSFLSELTPAATHAYLTLGSSNTLYETDGLTGGRAITLAGVAGYDGVREVSPFGAGVLFYARTAEHGYEPWYVDPTLTQARLVRDIWAGNTGGVNGGGDSLSGGFHGFTVVNGVAYFVAEDGTTQREIWRTDGTEVGTYLLADANGDSFVSSVPTGLTAYNGALYFAARSAASGRELFRSDGTAAGTVVASDTYPGVGSGGWIDPVVAGGLLYGFATEGVSGIELWATDATGASTRRVADSVPGPRGLYRDVSGRFDSQQTLAVGGVAYYAAFDPVNGFELWRSDGTTGGTFALAGGPDAVATQPYGLTAAPGGLFFFTDGGGEPALWFSDGTAAGTRVVRRFGFGAGDPRTYNLFNASTAVVNGVLYFVPFSSSYTSAELWRSDGTAAGTSFVADPLPDSVGGSSGIDALTEWNGRLYFAAVARNVGRGTSVELYVSDGTAAGTRVLQDPTPEGGGDFNTDVEQLAVLGGHLYFLANTNSFDGVRRRLWRTDGTPTGMAPVSPVDVRSSGQNPPVAVGGSLYFLADDAAPGGSGLWRTDGTPAGSAPVADIWPGGGDIPPGDARLVAWNGRVYFHAWDDGLTVRLWSSDGTAAGTRPVAFAGTPGTGYGEVVAHDGFLYFTAGDQMRLFRIDPVTGVATLVYDFPDDAPLATPYALASAGPRLFFVGYDSAGQEAWFTGFDDAPPAVTIAAPNLTNQSTQVVTLSATDDLSGFAPGALALLDVDLNGDGDFLDAGEAGFASAPLSVSADLLSATAAFALTLPDGKYTLRARLSDQAGNAGVSNTPSMVVDLTGPGPPVIAGIDDDTGLSPSDLVTNDSTLTVRGTGEAGGTVTVTGPGGLSLSVPINAAGNWSVVLPALAEGTRTLRATVTDASGNFGGFVDFTIVADRTAPAAPLFAPFARVTNVAAPVLPLANFDGGTAELFFADGTPVPGAVFDRATGSFRLPTLADGVYAFRARQIDVAGNVSPLNDVPGLRIDTVAPAAPALTAVEGDGVAVPPGGFTGDRTPVVRGTAEPGTIVTLTGAGVARTATADAAGNWLIDLSDAPLDRGAYSVTARSTDAAGNLSPASAAFNFEVRTPVPTRPLITGMGDDTGFSATDGITSDDTPTVSGSADPGTVVTVRLAGAVVGSATASAAGAWTVTLPSLPDGTHTFTATATRDDATGEPSTPRAVTVDTRRPTTVMRFTRSISATDVRFRLTVSDPEIALLPDMLEISGTAGATVSRFIAVTGTPGSYDVDFRYARPGSLRVGVRGDRFEDRAGNRNAATFADELAAAPPVTSSAEPPVYTVAAGPNGSAVLTFRDDAGNVTNTVTLPNTPANAPIRLTATDLDGDGKLEVIVSSLPGSVPTVTIYDGVTGRDRGEVQVFESSYTGGVNIVTGDIDGDGIPDIITSADIGGAPRVRGISGRTLQTIFDFFGIDDPNFRGGCRTAFGDLNGDGRGDILVIAGPGGGPRVAGYDGKALREGRLVRLFADFYAFNPTVRDGVWMTTGDMNGDGADDVLFGGGPGSGPRVFGLNGRRLSLGFEETLVNFFAAPEANRNGIRVAARSLPDAAGVRDGRMDLIVETLLPARTLRAYSGATVPAEGVPTATLPLGAFDDFALTGLYVG